MKVPNLVWPLLLFPARVLFIHDPELDLYPELTSYSVLRVCMRKIDKNETERVFLDFYNIMANTHKGEFKTAS